MQLTSHTPSRVIWTGPPVYSGRREAGEGRYLWRREMGRGRVSAVFDEQGDRLRSFMEDGEQVQNEAGG